MKLKRIWFDDVMDPTADPADRARFRERTAFVIGWVFGMLVTAAAYWSV